MILDDDNKVIKEMSRSYIQFCLDAFVDTYNCCKCDFYNNKELSDIIFELNNTARIDQSVIRYCFKRRMSYLRKLLMSSGYRVEIFEDFHNIVTDAVRYRFYEKTTNKKGDKYLFGLSFAFLNSSSTTTPQYSKILFNMHLDRWVFKYDITKPLKDLNQIRDITHLYS